jgi:nucleoside-diphosphate-sugar epimerase
MTIAVLGGTGFIGSEIVERLNLRGEPTVVISRGTRPMREGIVHETADRMNVDALISLLAKHQADAVIDLLPMTLANSRPVLEAAATVGARYVMISSADVYGNYGGLQGKETPTPVALLNEGSPLRAGRFPYRGADLRPNGDPQKLLDDYDKIPIEDAARADTRLKATILRLPMVYGPGDRQHRFRWIIEAARTGTLEIDEEAARWRSTYGYITNVAEAVALATLSDDAANRTYNVGEPNGRTPVELATLVAGATRYHFAVHTVPPERRGLLWEMAERSALEYPLELDTLRIRAELGFAEVVPEDEAIAVTTAWEEQSLSADS